MICLKDFIDFDYIVSRRMGRPVWVQNHRYTIMRIKMPTERWRSSWNRMKQFKRYLDRCKKLYSESSYCSKYFWCLGLSVEFQSVNMLLLFLVWHWQVRREDWGHCTGRRPRRNVQIY